jgi:hypothetical protein
MKQKRRETLKYDFTPSCSTQDGAFFDPIVSDPFVRWKTPRMFALTTCVVVRGFVSIADYENNSEKREMKDRRKGPANLPEITSARTS